MKKWLVSIGLAAAMAIATTATVLVAANDYKEDAPKQTAMLPASAYLGESYDIPEYTVGDKKAEINVITPDGALYSGNKIKLESAGLYKIEYVIDGVTVKTETCLCKYRGTDFFTGNRFVQAQGISTYKYQSNPAFTGVKYAVSQGAELAFTHVIDMQNRTKEDKLVELFIEPNEQKVLDFGQVILTFTDIEDDAKYFQVIASDGHLDSATSGGIAFVRAGANGQTAGGRNFSGSKEVFQTTDIYGSPAPFTFRAEFFEGETRYDYSLNVYYDTQENALYIKNSINEHYGERYLVADFDDVATFGGSVWEGFPSGKARLSISFDRFQTESGNIIVKEVDGIDFSQEEIFDEDAPTLTVDLKGEKDAPSSVLGNTYALFEATATDFFDGDVAVETKVQYQKLGADALYDVDVEQGKFVTDKVGRYVITYKAVDKFGNAAQQQFEFYCYGKAKEISLSNTQLDKATASVYERVEITPVNAVSATGGSGELHISCNVFAPDGSEVQLRDNKFLAEQLGQYRVEYTATDYFGNSETVTEYVSVSAVETPIFVDSPALPEVLVAGFTYVLPKISAVVCADGEVQSATVKTFVNGDEVSGEFTAAKGSDASVEYRAYYQGESGDYESILLDLPVVDGDYGRNQEAYFYSADGNVSVTENKENIELNIHESGSIVFANALNNKSFELTARYDAATTKYAAMRIVLADSASAATVTLKLAISASGITVATPNSASRPLYTRDGLFAIKYSQEDYMIKDVDNGVSAVISTDDSGAAFTGFKGAVYVKFYFDGVYGESALYLQALNGQALGYRREDPSLSRDTTAPLININGEYIYKQTVGKQITVYSADAFDVLGQVAEFTVTVRDPDNAVVFSGTPDKEHSFKLEKIGLYKIVYSASDCYGNRSPLTGSSVMANDAEKPTYSVNASFNEYYRVGAGVALPNVTVQDNFGKGYCDVFVELPNGEVRLLQHYADGAKFSYLDKADENYPESFKVDENTFKLETAGKYKVTFLFYDEAFNCEKVQYEFTAVA